MYRLAALTLALLCSAAACQHDVTTLFPAGLEPFPDDGSAAAIHAPVAEQLVMTYTNPDSGGVSVYGDGYIFGGVEQTWEAAQNPLAEIATCSTDMQKVTENDESGYGLDYIVHYTVNNILTVEWDDQYRGDVISVGLGSDQVPGDDGVPSRTMIKHQKTMGSSFITLSDGTTQMIASTDGSMTELLFVEHLNAAESPADQVEQGMQHEYDSLLSLVHGGGITTCPPKPSL